MNEEMREKMVILANDIDQKRKLLHERVKSFSTMIRHMNIPVEVELVERFGEKFGYGYVHEDSSERCLWFKLGNDLRVPIDVISQSQVNWHDQTLINFLKRSDELLEAILEQMGRKCEQLRFLDVPAPTTGEESEFSNE